MPDRFDLVRHPPAHALALALGDAMAQAGVVAPRLSHHVLPDLGAIRSVALSGDERVLALGGGLAQVFAVADGRTLARLEHPGTVLSVALDRNGTRLATGCSDGRARLWDVATGACLHTFAHAAAVLCVFLRGERLATGCADGCARLFDLQGEKLCTYTPPVRQDVRRVFFNGASMLTEGTGFSDLFDLVCGRLMAHYTAIGQDPGGRVHVSQCVSGVWAKSALIWDQQSATCRRRFDHPGTVHAAWLTSDGSTLATACADEIARLWDIADNQCTTLLRGHSDSIADVVMSPSARHVYTASDDQSARKWDAASARCLRRYGGDTTAVITLLLSADASQLFVAGHGPSIAQYDLASGRRTRTFAGHTGWVCSLALSEDGTRLLSGSHDGSAILWDVARGACLRTFEGGIVHAVAFGPDESTVITGTRAGVATVWDITTGAIVRELQGGGAWVRCLAVDRRRGLLLVGDERGALRQWDLASGTCVRHVVAHGERLHGIALAPDGATCFTASCDGTAKRWDLATGACRTLYDARPKGARTPFVTADGQRLVAGTFDHGARIWDTATGTCLKQFDRIHADWVRAAVLTPDGRRLITGSKDGRIGFFDAVSGAPLAALHNLDEGFLWTTPADDVAPHGWLWTDREELVNVGGDDDSTPAAAHAHAYLATWNTWQPIARRLDFGAFGASRLGEMVAARARLQVAEGGLLRIGCDLAPEAP